MPPPTPAPRHEVFEPACRPARAPTRVDERDPAAPHDLSDRDQVRPRRPLEPLGHTGQRGPRAGQQELVVLAAAGGPGHRIGAQCPGDHPRVVVDGQAVDLHPGSHLALLGNVAQIGGHAVGNVDHGGDAFCSAQPASLRDAGPGPKVGRGQSGERLGRNASGRLGTLEHGQAGRGSAQRAGDGHHVAYLRPRAELRGPQRLAQDTHVDEPAGRRVRGVTAHDGHPVLSPQGQGSGIEGLDFIHCRVAWTGQCHQGPARASAHGGDVGEIDRE
jgi:hypothetical protein